MFATTTVSVNQEFATRHHGEERNRLLARAAGVVQGWVTATRNVGDLDRRKILEQILVKEFEAVQLDARVVMAAARESNVARLAWIIAGVVAAANAGLVVYLLVR